MPDSFSLLLEARELLELGSQEASPMPPLLGDISSSLTPVLSKNSPASAGAGRGHSSPCGFFTNMEIQINIMFSA